MLTSRVQVASLFDSVQLLSHFDLPSALLFVLFLMYSVEAEKRDIVSGYS